MRMGVSERLLLAESSRLMASIKPGAIQIAQRMGLTGTFEARRASANEQLVADNRDSAH